MARKSSQGGTTPAVYSFRDYKTLLPWQFCDQ